MKNKIISIGILIAILIISISSSYAYFFTRNNNSSLETNATAALIANIEFVHGQSVKTPPEGIYPGWIGVQEFNINTPDNISKGTGAFEIVVETTIAEEYEDWVSIEVYKTTNASNTITSVEGEIVSNDENQNQIFVNDTVNFQGFTENFDSIISQKITSNTTSLVLDKQNFDLSSWEDTKYYVVYRYHNVNENQNGTMNKSFNAKINVNSIIKFDDTKDYYSTWIWQPAKITSNYVEELVDNGVDRVYLYFEVSRTNEFYKEKVKLLMDKGIKVEFLIGDPDYIYPLNYDRIDEFNTKAQEYNNSVDPKYKIDSIHIDTEPYTQSGWNGTEAERAELILLYQNHVIDAEATFKNYNVKFDVPFWYDEINYDNIEYNQGLLVDFVSNNSEGITIMAYNDDSGFIINVCEYEIQNHYNVEIAVEYGDLPGSEGVTFFDEGIDFMLTELEKVRNAYDTKYAIHQYILP